MSEKTCGGPCGRTLPETEEEFCFRKARNGKRYSSPWCRECERARSRESRRARWRTRAGKEAIKEQNRRYRSTPERKAVDKEKNRERYEADPEAVKARTRSYRAVPENRRRRNALWKKRYSLERDERRAAFKKRYRSDPSFRLRGAVRSRVWEAIRSAGGVKDGSVLRALGYSLEELKAHLESQFEPGMSWSPGTFTIDHIVPQSMFRYSSVDDPEFRLCWSLVNLRPLEASRNFSEGDRRHLFSGCRTFSSLLSRLRAAPPGSSPEELREVVRSLSGSEILDGRCPSSRDGLGVLDSVFTHRFASRSKGKPSLLEAYSDDFFLLRVVAYIVRSGRPVSPGLVYRNVAHLCRTPSHFFPSAAAALVRKLSPGGRVLDPFIGWGGRLLGSLVGGASSYSGCDLSGDSVSGASRLASRLGRLSDVSVRRSDFRDFLPSLPASSFDLFLTSPPFADSEDYGVGDMASRSSWGRDVMKPLAFEASRLLSPGGLAAVHCRNTRVFPMEQLVEAAFVSERLRLSRCLPYGPRGQVVLVFSR